MYHAQREQIPALMSFHVMLEMPIDVYNNHLLQTATIDKHMINIQPICRRKLAKSKPEEKEITCMTEESMETLNDSFDATDWNIFVNNAEDIDELVDIGLNIFYSEEKDWARHTTRQCPLQRKYLQKNLITHTHTHFRE